MVSSEQHGCSPGHGTRATHLRAATFHVLSSRHRNDHLVAAMFVIRNAARVWAESGKRIVWQFALYFVRRHLGAGAISH